MGIYYKGGMFMTFGKSCKFYEDSKCILSGGCCDLDCSLANSERDNPFYDEYDEFTKWKMKKSQEEKRLESKLT
jgi:hypothetical protein